jgi:Domain of unknown function (DUF4261)
MQSDVEQIYAVELLFETAPKIQPDILLGALQRTCPGIKPMGDLHFAHSSHLVQYDKGALPAQILLFPSERKDDKTKIEDAVQQSWNLPTAKEIVSSLPHKILVNDLMARGLPHKERLSIFLDALEAIVTTLRCGAIHWRASQQVTSSAFFLEARRKKDRHILFAGPLNVRFFNTPNNRFPDEALADTMGLSVFGLPDIQCHFHGLDVNQMVPLLYNIGVYLFENGDVIESGHTIPGIEAGENWRCQHENSLVAPKRVVLDINPGPKYAAGNRN